LNLPAGARQLLLLSGRRSPETAANGAYPKSHTSRKKHKEKMQGIVAVIVLATSIWVFIDSKKIGVQKGQIKGILNMGRTGWVLSCLFIWIIAFPCYLAKRGEYQRINGK
jgi:hypothetical protein